MKRVFIALFFILPLISKSQCPIWIGQDVKAAVSLEPVVEQYTMFKMKLRDTAEVNYKNLSFFDSAGFASMNVELEQKKELRGTEIVKLPATVKSIYINGPADRIDKMVKEYFEPMITACNPKTSPTWYMWNGIKLVFFKTQSRDGIPMKFIEISKE